MARILISYFSDYGEAMYDSICDELKNNNDILQINTNGIISFKRWGDTCTLKNREIIKKVLKFNPNLILNFNNSLPIEITKKLHCVNCIIDADNPETFWNKKYILRNSNKFKYLGLQEYSKKMYEKFLKKKFIGKNYLFFPPATSIRAKKIKKKFNISFIGSNFYPIGIPNDDFFYSKKGLIVYNKFKKNYFYNFYKEKRYSNQKKEENYINNCINIRAFYVGQDRLKYMSMLTDLGFTFFGVRWWNKIAYYDFDLASCFNPKKITSNKQNQWVYNSSKISINISHPQAKTSFSWRVMDIMASDSCLLMEHKSDWEKLFGQYVSDKVKKMIFYKDRYDLREKCIFLLKNNDLRKKCIHELQNAIEKNGRWKNRLLLLEKFTGIKLIHNNKLPNSIYKYIKIEEKINKKNLKEEAITHHLRIKTRVKLIWFSAWLIINQFPFINKLFIDRDTLFDNMRKTIEDDKYNKN